MNTSTSELAIARLGDLLQNPALLGLIVLSAVAVVAAILSEKGRWAVFGLLIASATVSFRTDMLGNWLRPPAPLDQLVLYGRSITGALLIAVFAGALIERIRSPSSGSPTVALLIIALHALLCFKYIVFGNIIDGAVRFATYASVFFVFGLAIPSQLNSVILLRRLLWSMGLAAIGFCLLQVAVMFLDFEAGSFSGRWFGTTNNPNQAAIACALLLPATLGLASLKSQKQWLRLCMWSVAAMLIIILIMTKSRGGALTAAIGLLGFFRVRLGSGIFLLVPLVMLIYLLSGWFGLEGESFERLTSTEDTRSGSLQLMLEQWLESPLYGTLDRGWHVGENGYLGVLVRTGLFGGALLIAIIYSAVKLMAQALRVRPALGDDAVLVDVGIGGLLAFAANNMLESSLFANLTAAIFLQYLFIALLYGTVRVGTPMLPTQTVLR